MVFKNVIGQENVKKQLVDSALAGKVRHAYIFNGPQGVGRKTAAWDFITMLTCSDMTACGKCTGCILCEKHTNPDIVIVSNSKNKASIGVEEIRNMENSIITAPEYGKYKFFIIENGELMTPQAQNALLKTLEEPPVYAIIIIICSNISAMIDTVRSRCIQIDFARNSKDDISSVLKNKAGITDESLIEKICDYSDGSIGRSLDAVNSDDYIKIQEQVINTLKLVNNSSSAEAGKLYIALQKLFTANQEKKEILFFFLQTFFRSIMIDRNNGNQVDLYDKIGYYKAVHCLELIENTWKQIKQNVNYKLATESLVIKMSKELRKAK